MIFAVKTGTARVSAWQRNRESARRLRPISWTGPERPLETSAPGTERFASRAGDFFAGPEARILFRRRPATGRAAREGAERSPRQAHGASQVSGRRSSAALTSRIAQHAPRSIGARRTVEIDGLGTVVAGGQARVSLRGAEQASRVHRLRRRGSGVCEEALPGFRASGFRPWLDKKKLMPGQNWPRAIETAIQTSDFFVACFSRRATSKRGSFHSELRYALFCAAKVPLDEIFLIPLRLDECVVPRRISKQMQYLDLFPDWEAGVEPFDRRDPRAR